MSPPTLAPLFQRTLSAVYRFYDAFFFPIDERTPPILSPLQVSVPALDWAAWGSAEDSTYRFSAATLGKPAPSGVNLEVAARSSGGDYLSHEPILLTLPLPVSTPPRRSEFLIVAPLWPTAALRPPQGETALRGHLLSATAQPVADLKVEAWAGPSPVPPAGTPYTRTDRNGDFLIRFPQMKGHRGIGLMFQIRLSDGAVPVSPASPTLLLGQTQVIAFQRN